MLYNLFCGNQAQKDHKCDLKCLNFTHFPGTFRKKTLRFPGTNSICGGLYVDNILSLLGESDDDSPAFIRFQFNVKSYTEMMDHKLSMNQFYQ